MTTKTQKPRTDEGKFNFEHDYLCECGHLLSDHLANPPRACGTNGTGTFDCDCKDFKKHVYPKFIWIQHYKCGCVDTQDRKKDLMGYCGKHGSDSLETLKVPFEVKWAA